MLILLVEMFIDVHCPNFMSVLEDMSCRRTALHTLRLYYLSGLDSCLLLSVAIGVCFGVEQFIFLVTIGHLLCCIVIHFVFCPPVRYSQQLHVSWHSPFG